MGFFTMKGEKHRIWVVLSQSLSGWDGVFHRPLKELALQEKDDVSQSLSGWDGVFHMT